MNRLAVLISCLTTSTGFSPLLPSHAFHTTLPSSYARGGLRTLRSSTPEDDDKEEGLPLSAMASLQARMGAIRDVEVRDAPGKEVTKERNSKSGNLVHDTTIANNTPQCSNPSDLTPRDTTYTTVGKAFKGR